MNIYERLGVRTIINAYGPATRLGGAPMAPEVGAAMLEATRFCVDIGDLQGAASHIIASVTGAEAGIVTSGAASALLLAAAACITRLDPLRMNRLPDITGMRNEILVPRSHRNSYDHAVRASGATLVEVGIADRFNGAGIRDCETWELIGSISERTAAILYLAAPQARPSLSELAAAAHVRSVPVIVDAAAQLPPVNNLRRYIAEGADLVAFSGGKAIGGPQASGILCGRRELVAAAALQLFDHDVHPVLWSPPSGLIDRGRLQGAPRHGIGRTCKVGKEQIVGLLVALQRFVETTESTRTESWTALAKTLATRISSLSHCQAVVVNDGEVPFVEISLDEETSGWTAVRMAEQLQKGTPPIYIEISRIDEGVLRFGPTCMHDAEIDLIGERFKEILTGRSTASGAGT